MKEELGLIGRFRSRMMCGAVAAVLAGLPLAAMAEPIPEIEESDVAEMPALQPHWIMLSPPFATASGRIFDGDSGKMLGSVHISPMANVQFDPAGRYIYVAETIWTKGNRGTRQDMISVYDIKTLKLVTEIPLPGRLLTGNRNQTFALSADGKLGYVYEMAPATSIIVVDLVRRKVAQTVEIGGCGMAFAAGNDKVAALCGDGTLSTITIAGSKNTVAQSNAFFAADDDPIFDNSVTDPRTGKAIFLSYTGMVYETTIGGSAPVGPGWSLQEAAGMARVTNAPLQPSWLPGGRQLMAYHAPSNRLFVLMHMGEFWSQKEDGEELWEVDLGAHKVIARHRLKESARSLWVSPDAKPQLYLNAGGAVKVIDLADWSVKHEIEDIDAVILNGPVR